MVAESTALSVIAKASETAYPHRYEAQLRFSSEIAPQAEEQRTKLQERLVNLDYVRPGLETTGQRFRNQMGLCSPATGPLHTDLAKLSTEWSKVIGAMTVDGDGEERTPAQMAPFLEDNDRQVRERAFRKMFKPYVDQRDALADLFDRMYDLRQSVARNAGFENFRDYAHREKNRFDYTSDDCFRFHDAVEHAVAPAVKRLQERRRAHLGVARLRPWDQLVDPKGRAPLRPYSDVDDFIQRAGSVFAHLQPDFKRDFETMAEARLLDLDNRKGKAPGGFCDSLPAGKLPLTFLNAVNVHDDARTLLPVPGPPVHAFGP